MTRNRIILLVAMLIGATTIVHAQFHEVIRTGRPGQGIGPYVIGAQVFQIQSGAEYYRTKAHDGSPLLRQFVHNNIFRFGHTERFEWNALVNWQIDQQDDMIAMAGVSALEAGFRVNVLQRRGAVPALGIQYRLLLPWTHEPYAREHLGSRVTVATMNKLRDKVNVVLNLALGWDGNQPGPTTTYTLSTSFDLTSRLGGFVEMYGNIDQGTRWFDGGLSYLVTNDFQIDFYGGTQPTEQAQTLFLSAGISWRWVDQRHKQQSR